MTTKKYKMPSTLKKLISLDNQLQEQDDMSLDDVMGFQILEELDEEDSRDECTPTNAIVFASTGVDGDHFAFLHGSRTSEDLELAPIVFVQPMDTDQPVKLVARNLKDLLGLYIHLKDFYVLERFDWYESEEVFMSDYRAHYEEEIQEGIDEIEFIIRKLLVTFDVEEISNPYTYISNLRKENLQYEEGNEY